MIAVKNLATVMRELADAPAFERQRTRSAADEIERLSRIEKAARAYYVGYAQGEADDPTICVDLAQHAAAVELRDALGPTT